MEKVASNEEKIEQIHEEATYNVSAVAKQLNNIGTTTKDTQTCISALEAKTTSLKTRNAENPTNANNINSFATSPTFKPKGKSDANQGLPKPNTNPLAAHHPCCTVIRFLPDSNREEGHLEPALIVSRINNAMANSPSLKARHIKVIAAAYNNQGNLIISTHADQLAADLLQYSETFLPLISQGYQTSTLTDK